MIVSFAAGTTIYLTRRTIAREVLVGWLEARGVPAEVDFREFDFGGFTARVRAGAPNDPDVSISRVEVRYGLTGFWQGEPLGVRVISVRLYRPVLKAAFRDGKLSLGGLDPLVEEFARRPPQPQAPQPRVEIRRGVLNLATDYGPMKLTGDGRLERGKLMALDARLDPVRLRGKGLEAGGGGGRLRRPPPPPPAAAPPPPPQRGGAARTGMPECVPARCRGCDKVANACTIQHKSCRCVKL